MLVVVTAENDTGLKAPISGHFGHAPYFSVIELVDGKVVKVKPRPNPHAVEHKPGQVPTFVKELGADVIITGGMGENAAKIFEKLGIQALAGASGTVEEALAAYHAGTLSAAKACAHEGHGHGHHHDHEGGHGHHGGAITLK